MNWRLKVFCVKHLPWLFMDTDRNWRNSFRQIYRNWNGWKKCWIILIRILQRWFLSRAWQIRCICQEKSAVAFSKKWQVKPSPHIWKNIVPTKAFRWCRADSILWHRSRKWWDSAIQAVLPVHFVSDLDAIRESIFLWNIDRCKWENSAFDWKGKIKYMAVFPSFKNQFIFLRKSEMIYIFP